LISADLILLSDYAFRRLFGIAAGQATDLVVTVRNKKEIPTIAAKILELLPDSRSTMSHWRMGIMA